MKADARMLEPLDARAHCERCAPGQRPTVQALMELQSQGAHTTHRFVAAQPDAGSDDPAAATPLARDAGHGPPAPNRAARSGTAAAAQLQGVEHQGPVQFVSAQTLGWQAADAADPPPDLGELDPWPVLPPGVTWVDLSISVHRQGRWLGLHAELQGGDVLDLMDEAATSGLGPCRVRLQPRELNALAAMGITLADLRAATAPPAHMHWALRGDGLGVFLAGLIDMGWDR